MDISSGKKAWIEQGWLRVLLFLLFFLFMLLVLTIPALLMFAPIKPSELITDLPQAIDNLANNSLWLMALIEFLSAMVAVYLFRKFVDRKNLLSLGISLDGHFSEIMTGFFLAPAIIGLGVIFLFFTKHLEWDSNDFNAQSFAIDLGTLVLIAISEEIVFRGYVLNNLMQSFHKWIALVVSSLLFALFHLSNPGISILPLMSLFLVGILVGLNYTYTQNLWFSIALHFSWNFFQGILYGFKVSGIQLYSLLQANLKGDSTITGGDFGFEGSVLATALLFFVVVIFYFVYERKFASEKVNV
ncbi:MAG: CPBP family intramembrane metalloprotease [Bacteroidetes bacterium]|nr:CPBP family intramembrane metalloprotease [Bacteroidota bacterium]